MKERPILFSAPMVRAILAGAKSQTRRVVKWPRVPARHDPDYDAHVLVEGWPWLHVHPGDGLNLEKRIPCPYGDTGDRLWVRETWAPNPLAPAPDRTPYVLYRANGDGDKLTKWKPSIFMLRHSSRILLEITEVRVEQLRDISETDAIAEGVRTLPAPQWHPNGWRQTYIQLWDDIHGDRASEENPYVWILEFTRISP